MELLQEILGLYAQRADWFAGLLMAHIGLALTAIAMSGTIGLLTGVWIAEHPRIAPPVMGVCNVLYTIPAISLLGILIPFSGIGNKTAVIALTIYGIMPMVRNTYVGLTTLDPDILEAARGMGSTGTQALFRVKLPMAAGVILAGVRNTVVMTISVAGIASFVGAGGLGVAIYRGITIYDPAMTAAGSILIALLAIVCDLALGALERYFKREEAELMKILNRLPAAVLAILMLVTLAGCGGGAAAPSGETGSGAPVRIATKPMTEQYILGEMLGLLIEQAGYDVEITKGVGGGTSNIQPAMESGEFDLYPEYTSSGWVLVLDHQAEGVDDAEMFTRLQQEYEEKFDMTWVGKYGFNNTFTVAVRGDVAEQYGLETTSDLAGAAGELTFGGNPDYLEREDGFPTLCKTYGLDFRNVVDIDIGLKYQALASGDIDVTNAFTTDAQLANPDTDLVTLEDDKHLQVNYFCSTVVRRDALEKFPGLEEVLMQMDGILSDGEMAALNYQVEVEGRDERDAARDFLLQKGMLEA